MQRTLQLLLCVFCLTGLMAQ